MGMLDDFGQKIKIQGAQTLIETPNYHSCKLLTNSYYKRTYERLNQLKCDL